MAVTEGQWPGGYSPSWDLDWGNVVMGPSKVCIPEEDLIAMVVRTVRHHCLWGLIPDTIRPPHRPGGIRGQIMRSLG
jgi:hypothetical protein